MSGIGDDGRVDDGMMTIIKKRKMVVWI